MLLVTSDWDSVFTAVPIFAMAFLGQVCTVADYYCQPHHRLHHTIVLMYTVHNACYLYTLV
jgi:hypothetical protein